MSNSSATQIKVTLPNELYLHLKSKAEKFGLNLASYIRHLVINDVKDVNIPVFKMSKSTEKVAVNAIRDYKRGKIKVIESWDKYFRDLASTK